MMKNLIKTAALLFLSTITTLVNGQNECPLLIDDMTCDCNLVNSNQTEYTINCYQQTYSISDEAIMSIESMKNNSNISSYNEVIKSVFIKDKIIYKLPDFAINTSIPLEWLSLESTQIHEISKDAFSNLVFLERLTLTENNLTRLDFNVIRDLDRLESLELIANRIESIDLCIGKAMNLNELLLGQNFIANLSSFEDFPFLNTLNINNNYLENIESYLFSNLSMLQILDLSYNKISKIDPNSFAGLISLEQLDLDNNYLTFIDESILNGTRNLRNINLDGNKLVDIYSNSFQANYIDLLDLSYQNIKQIDSKAFSMSTELTTIDLQHNQLKHLNPGFIYNLTALDTIKLSFNLLETLVYDNFGTFDSIKFLHFDNNYISSIEKGAFIHLENLRNLYLNINLLRELNSDMFLGLENLQNLQVDYNKLSVIDSQTFQFLPNLQAISLQYNYITSIEANSFKNQGVLTEIDLNNNQLTEIDEDSFNGLSNLFQINLQGNQIESIAAGAFSDMSSLMYIALSSNKITSLNSGVFNGLELLSMIDLGSNRLVDIEGAFNGLTNLQSLFLSNNLINSINNRTFANLDNLVELDLAFNPLNSVENGSLEQLTELNALTLNNIASNPLKLARLSVFEQLNRLGLSGTQFDINNETFGDNLDTMEYLILRKVGLKDVDNLHLKRMTRLVSLDLSDNNLDWVTFCSNQRLFERAKNLQYLYLSNTSLKDLNCIGLNLPNKLNTLDLSNNQIESIEANVFKFDCVEPNTRRGCLKSLNLNNNPIKVIKPGSFDYVRGLGNLYMNSNMFSSKDSLENMNVNLLNWLFILEMSNSNLTIFPLFDRYSENGYKLETLRLGNNRIGMLSSSHFDYLQGLIYLDLGNNLISRIENTNIFFSSPKLETINLSRNLIDDYNLNLINFDLCNNLKYLNLSYNKLTVLNRDLFNGLKKLETIDISYNGLVQIESNTFNKLSVLKYLYLYGIYFSDAKKSGQTQSTVNISGNFAHGCSLLKFVYISSLDLIESNLDSISSSLKAAEANKIVNGAVYYNSINIIVNNFDYYKSERKNACKLTILLLKHRIHVNLFSDFDFDMFISNCYSLDLIEDLQ